MHNEMNIVNNSFLHIDLILFKKNIRTLLASLREGAALIPVLKNDAYGLGLVQMAFAAADFSAVRCIAVAHVSEGLALRAQGFTKDILVMSSALPFQLPAAVRAGLILTAGTPDFVRALDAAAHALDRSARVHIKIDTGLHRIGAAPGAELAALAESLRAASRVVPEGVFSHFADTENAAFTREQFALFLQGVAQLEALGFPRLMRHISCSGAHERYPQYDLDAVRIGRALYMDSPDGVSHGIEEFASWRSYVTAVRRRNAGDGLGYGGEFFLPHDATVATLGVGYGDGLDPALCRVHAPVLIGGRECPLLACCMDQSFADVSAVACAPGSLVTIFGRDENGLLLPVQAQSTRIGGNEGCALTSALSARVARCYVGSLGRTSLTPQGKAWYHTDIPL